MKRYSREAILRDKRFLNYQKDFLKVILVKEQYTIAEAQKAALAFFKKKGA